MAQYACIVQASQSPESKRVALTEGLKRIAHEVLAERAESVEVSWITVAEGFGFTAGRPSTSSLVVRSVPAGFPDERRAALMTKVSELWQDVTGCTADEIVVTAIDGPLPL